MKSLFNAESNKEIINRINQLQPDMQPIWGKMTVSQMLAHCQQPMHVALGDVKPKRMFAGILFGNIAKKKLLSDKPFQRNLPTDKTFIVRDQREFLPEKEKLIRMVERFLASGPEGLSKDPHPFFGRMTPEEWDRLSWKHLDHHLQQFGV